MDFICQNDKAGFIRKLEILILSKLITLRIDSMQNKKAGNECKSQLV